MSVASLGSKEICKRYSRAVLDLAKEKNALKTMMEEASELLDILENSEEMKDLISSPLYTAQEQENALNEVLNHLNYSEIMKGFIRSLCENRRIFLLGSVLNMFLSLATEAMGIKVVSVYSSKPLSEAQQGQLIKNLQDKLNCQIRLDLHVRPSLKGGLRIEVDSTMIDNSIQTKLKSYHQAIKGAVS